MLGHKINSLQKSLFLDLYRTALVDGILSNEELQMLQKIGQERGVSVEEIHEIIRNPNLKQHQMKDDDEKIRYLADVTKIIIADATIKDEELYLWDQIASKFFKNKDKNEVLKKEMFSKVIDEHIRAEIGNLKILKKSLKEELEDKINKSKIDSVSQDEIERLINEIKEKYARGIYSIPVQRFPRIFIIGQFKEPKGQIRSILRSAFEKNGIKLTNKSFVFAVSTNYNEVKSGHKQAVINAANGSFDFLLYGPHPHNIHGCGERSWEVLLKDTETVVNGSYTSILTKKDIEKVADSIANWWVSLKSKSNDYNVLS